MSASNGFTPTQRNILTLLADGRSHSRDELRDCIGDEHTSLSAVQMQISLLRKKLVDRGELIVCEMNGWRITYRHVRMLSQ